MRVSKWGNSLAVRLPKKVVDKLGLKEGDEVTLGVSEDGATFEVSRDEQIEAALRELRMLRGTLPADIQFDREEANAR
jgi:antitoxin MazE